MDRGQQVSTSDWMGLITFVSHRSSIYRVPMVRFVSSSLEGGRSVPFWSRCDEAPTTRRPRRILVA